MFSTLLLVNSAPERNAKADLIFLRRVNQVHIFECKFSAGYS